MKFSLFLSVCVCVCVSAIWFRQLDICVLVKRVKFPKNVGIVCSRKFGIVTCYRLDSPGIESRLGARFHAPIQTSPGAHPAYCAMGTGSISWGKHGQSMALTTHPHLALWLMKE